MSLSNDNEDDIYRGEVEREPTLHSQVASSVSSCSSSSDSLSFLAGGRFGAIAAKLELAISRWAKHVRGNSSSASSSSTTSSASSLPTISRSQFIRRRRRRLSVSSLHTLHSEREIAARITRLKALRISRQITREFGLYLPPSIREAQSASQTGVDLGPNTRSDRPAISTSSLPTILNQIEVAIRNTGRQHRHRHRRRGNKTFEEMNNPLLSFAGPSTNNSLTTSASPVRRDRKGKAQANNIFKPTTIVEEPHTKPQAWFLDIANPSWADLRAIGKLLHVHPLTLEDILQQDPREKVEDFTKLGYYFISFRTIESQATRVRIQHDTGILDSSGNHDEGSIGEANIYLAVFNNGICCFHFTDISEHTDRVHNRMHFLGQNAAMSSDWIAHAILDSIVDSFFPLLGEVEKEIIAIDQTIFSNEGDISQMGFSVDPIKLSSDVSTEVEKPSIEKIVSMDEKISLAERVRESYHTRFASPRLSIRLAFRRFRRRISFWKGLWTKAEARPSVTQLTLRRMARAKKLVTVLGRLLNAKSDVITGIKKRLVKAVESGGTGHKGQMPDELEVVIYMGDIQDHILTLQQSLGHIERLLNQSHSAYMSQLRSGLELTKGGIDLKVLYLTSISLSVICIQTLTGMFSMNVTVPHNLREPNGRYIVFCLVLFGAAIILMSMFTLVRYWWKKAHRRHRKQL